ncbi:hypothetical protein BESB_044110 [Besnoitia besnoiti]|uniref:Uncharacterized protein n=1 Tax=Besnoitia besnoiti TaxID=94643 RepID=A0A2A9MEB6_BESBE|nr:hypothetical protein BESB_044110 [Besnoitia besnoiti]PFH36219.1 hypothetical protein BESB_044110 [Besnoitia besnoiti]
MAPDPLHQPISSIVLPDEGSLESSGLFLIDLQGHACVSDSSDAAWQGVENISNASPMLLWTRGYLLSRSPSVEPCVPRRSLEAAISLGRSGLRFFALRSARQPCARASSLLSSPVCQGNAFVADAQGRSAPSLVPLPEYRPRFRRNELSSQTASSFAASFASSAASNPAQIAAQNDVVDAPGGGERAQGDEKIYDAWGIVEWEGAPQAAAAAPSGGGFGGDTSFFSPSGKCQLHVGSLVLAGRVEAAVSNGGGLVLVRRVWRPKTSREQRKSTSAPLAQRRAEAAQAFWEIQAVVSEKVVFSKRPVLHPSKKLFADAQAPGGGEATASGKAAGVAAAPGASAQAKAREKSSTARPAASAAAQCAGASWLLGVSPQLALQEEGDWRILAVDAHLLRQIKAGDPLCFKGIPRLLFEASAADDERPGGESRGADAAARQKRQETLLCCRDGVYAVNRNEIDGQLLIAFKPPVEGESDEDAAMSSDGEGDAAANGGEPCNGKQPTALEKAGSQTCGGTSHVGVRTAGLKATGVPVVGICKSILLLEPALGRTTQIPLLLNLRYAPAAVRLLSAWIEANVAEKKEPLLSRLAQLGARPGGPHHDFLVLPSALFLDCVQASEEDLVAALVGGQFSNASCTFRQRKGVADASSPSSASSSSLGGSLAPPPAFWGSAGFASSLTCLLFLPACGGYCALELPLLLDFMQRLLNFFAFLEVPADALTLGDVMDLIGDMESKGFTVAPFSTSPQAQGGGSVAGGGMGRQPLQLEPGVLFQLLARVCDLKLQARPRFPMHFFDVCPSLCGDAAASWSALTAAGGADSEEGEDSGDAADCLQAYEAFLADAEQVRQCRVRINWVKLHRLLALAVFHESGMRTRLQCGIDAVAHLPVHAIPLTTFCGALAEKLASLPLAVTQAADSYLAEGLEDYRRYLRRGEEARMRERIEESKKADASSSFVPFVDLDAQTKQRLLAAAANVPLVRYALVKRALEAFADEAEDAARGGEAGASGDAGAPEVDVLGEGAGGGSRSAQTLLPSLSGMQILQANTVAFPELRIPADSPRWNGDIGAQVPASVLAESAHKAFGKTRKATGGSDDGAFETPGSPHDADRRGTWGRRDRAEEKSPARGLPVYEEAFRKAKQKKGVMAAHLAVLAGVAFYGRKHLIHVAEERLPLEVRERLAVLFMCKSRWWSGELQAFIAPSLLGKDLMETVAGPPRRHCEARQIVLNKAEDDQNDDVGVVFFSHNLPLPFWDV